jgi:hypothetical protein
LTRFSTGKSTGSFLQISNTAKNIRAEQDVVSALHSKIEDLVRLVQKECTKRQTGDKALLEAVAASRKDEAAMRDKLVSTERDKSDLVVRLANAETERASLLQQVCIRVCCNR